MFGRRANRDKMEWDEWSGADSWSASNVESIESAKSPFSFFSFNLFESEEKFQGGSSNSDGSDDDDDDDADDDDEIEETAQNSFFGLSWPRVETQEVEKLPDLSIQKRDIPKQDDMDHTFKLYNDAGSRKTEATPRGRFWRHGMKKNVVPHHNRFSRCRDNSEDFNPPMWSPNDAFFSQKQSQPTMRVYAKPKDLIQKHLKRTKNYDFRDEIEANNSRVSGQHRREPAVHLFSLGNQTLEERDGVATNRNCFPAWPFKNRASIPEEEYVDPEPDVKPVVPITIEEIRTPRPVKVEAPPTAASLAAKISATRKKTHSQQVSKPYLYDFVEEDIWDESTTSSGWFTLESLDGR